MSGARWARRAALRSVPLLLGPLAAELRWALERPAESQARLRRRISAALAKTDYGRAHGLKGPDDFEALPVVSFEALHPWIERQRAWEQRALCAEPVRHYEKTSGSSGAAKYIPYTGLLRHQFSKMFGAWAFDLLLRAPKLQSGKVYLSTSPQLSAPLLPLVFS